jgi:xanthine dehydrogenase accessory factor
MSTDRHACVLISGIGETASAIARELFLADHIVAMHQAAPPPSLRRKMTFSDAWFDGSSVLEGVEARRADLVAEFMLGLRTRMFIPLLTHPFAQIIERWPWEVIVDADVEGRREQPNIKNLAGLTIGVGGDYVAGDTCDLVIESQGNDPGAIVRPGDAVSVKRPNASGEDDAVLVRAGVAGIFSTTKDIGNVVENGEPVGAINGAPIPAPFGGRIRGLLKHGRAVAAGTPIADIAVSTGAQVAGMTARNRLIARGVAFAIEMQVEGWAPFSWDELLEGGGGGF